MPKFAYYFSSGPGKLKRTVTAGKLITMAADEAQVGFIPHILHFGNVCQGFMYQLTGTLINKATRPQKFKIRCVPTSTSDLRSSSGKSVTSVHPSNPIKVIYESRIVAPGLSVNFILEMKAQLVGNCRFNLIVVQGLDNSEARTDVTANVMLLDAFKHMSHELLMQKKEIYHPGVKPVSASVPASSAAAGGGGAGTAGQLSPPRSPGGTVSASITSGLIEEKSLVSNGTAPSAASMVTEALLDPEDIDELLLYPMLPNLYWDPKEKILVWDEVLSKVLYSTCTCMILLHILTPPLSCIIIIIFIIVIITINIIIIIIIIIYLNAYFI